MTTPEKLAALVELAVSESRRLRKENTELRKRIQCTLEKQRQQLEAKILMNA